MGDIHIKNYILSYLFLRIHGSIPPPPKLNNQSRTTAPAFISGYRLHGEYYYDERITMNYTVEGTIFHLLRLVIDNNSFQSTKLFLDNDLIGSFQEHFVPRLKGGVFVTHKVGSVGLFQNFVIKGCNKFNADGKCLDGIQISHTFLFALADTEFLLQQH